MKRGKANLTDILDSLRDDDIRRLWAMRNQRKRIVKTGGRNGGRKPKCGNCGKCASCKRRGIRVAGRN